MNFPSQALSPRTQLGQTLRSIRIRRNLTAKEAATKAKLNLAEYSQIERQPERRSMHQLSGVLRALEMNEAEWLELSEIICFPQAYTKAPQITQ
jgi:transcriptional regulator with XRE-family HTH domain